jgi:alkylation response protein AidB-like acyl-CoA dehydrogenase
MPSPRGCPERHAAAATARIGASQAYEKAARENLQLHGGIGFTWEANYHFHYRRARLLALNIGSAEVWTDTLIDALAERASTTPAA